MRFFSRPKLRFIQCELFFDDPQAEPEILVLISGLDCFEFSKLQAFNEGNYTPLVATVRKWLTPQNRKSDHDLEVLLEWHFN